MVIETENSADYRSLNEEDPCCRGISYWKGPGGISLCEGFRNWRSILVERYPCGVDLWRTRKQEEIAKASTMCVQPYSFPTEAEAILLTKVVKMKRVEQVEQTVTVYVLTCPVLTCVYSGICLRWRSVVAGFGRRW